MKKTITCIALAAGLLAQGAMAAPSPDRNFAGMVFSSRGECERAMSAERNDNRQAGDTDRYGSADRYNAYVRWYFACVEVDKNAWIVMRTR